MILRNVWFVSTSACVLEVWAERGVKLCLFCSRTDLESEEIVSELVHSFLIPEAQKQSIRQKGWYILG